MFKTKTLTKFTAMLLIFSFLIFSFCACWKNEENGDRESGLKNSYNLTGFSIVYQESSQATVIQQTQKLKKAIKSIIGINLSINSDRVTKGAVIDKNAKEILVGNTNRKASSDALEKLTSKGDSDSYIIQMLSNKIVIVGTSGNATLRAVKEFIKKYVEKSTKGTSLNISAGGTIVENYDSSKIIHASNGVEFETVLSSTIKEAPQNTWGTGIGYPTIIELQHSGESNGKIIASYSIADSGKSAKSTSFRIMESNDGGETWEQLSEVFETIDVTIEACWNPHLFELPEQVGDMPAGTILLAGCSIDAGQQRKSHITLWKSFDCGNTWEQFAVVSEGGGVGEGVWEPYLYYEAGYLYCFYSEDSLNEYDQIISYRRSKDGKVWEDIVHVVAGRDFSCRPGMGVFTKMGNGQYFMVYEIGGVTEGVPIYYKLTEDVTNWNPFDLGQPLIGGSYTMGSAPWCAWTPIGGECGTLIVTSKYGSENPNKILVSFDYGKTFEAVNNPLPYSESDGLGYSASLFFSVDGTTLFYANNVNGEGEKSKIAFTKIKIYE